MFLQERRFKAEHAWLTSGRNRALESKGQNLYQASHPEGRFGSRVNNGDGTVPSWTAARENARTNFKGPSGLGRAYPLPTAPTSRSSSPIDSSSGGTARQKTSGEDFSTNRQKNSAHTDFTVVSGYIEFFILVGGGTLLGALWAVFH
jgi:hypothetical protein